MRRLARLRRMSWSEMAGRGRQTAHRWIDRVIPAFGPAGQPRRLRRDAARPDTDVGDLETFRTTAARRFFAGVESPDVGREIATRFPVETAALLAAADRRRDGCFDLLGYENVRFGTPVDWHLDPIAGRRAPLRHWSRIDPLDVTQVGDSKVIWELNRHQWLVTLAQAYRVTGDERYAACALDQVDAWAAANPYPAGVNWASSLEAALRLIAWCWTLLLLRDSPSLDDDRFDRWRTLMRAHALHIERYLSHHFSPNTHLTGEALGLVYAGVVFADSRDAARWRDLGRRILIDELDRQVTSDGVYFEQATCYHRYTAEIYLHLLALSARNRLIVPGDVRSAIERLMHALLALCGPDRSMPAIGDADGGWLLPLGRRDSRDCREVFALAAVVFDQPEFAWAAGPAPVELAWTFGRGGLDAFARLRGRPPAAPPSRAFRAGGYAVMRSGWQPDAHHLVVDVGPLGCSVSGAHGHADLLSLHCSAFGEDYLVDAGTYCYTGDRAWRDYFRSSRAHSTLVVDGQSQADPAGPFSWRDRPAVSLHAWESTSTHDFVDAAHDGYARLAHPVHHRRRVLFVKPAGWVVVDDVTGDGEHDLELRFLFSPRAVALAADQWVRAQGRHGQGLWLRTISGRPLSVEIREGQADPPDGWISTAYGQRCPAPVAVYRAAGALPLRFTTLIVPADPIAAEPPPLDIALDAESDAIGFRFPFDDRRVRVTADALTLTLAAGRLQIA